MVVSRDLLLYVVLAMEIGEESLENKMEKMGGCSRVTPKGSMKTCLGKVQVCTIVTPYGTTCFEEEVKAVLLLSSLC